MDEGNQELEKINPTPLNPEKPFAADRQTAISEALSILSSLPLRRAAAIHGVISALKGRSTDHFSLVNILEDTNPTVTAHLLKKTMPNQETNSLDERRKIWEQAPDKFAEELARDNERQDKSANRMQRWSGQANLNVNQILAARTLPADPDFKLSLRELSALFDPISGKIIVPAKYNLSNSVFAQFYDDYHKVGYFQSDQGQVELRGRTFYTDKEKGSVRSKLLRIQDDLDRTLAIVTEYAEKRSEISNSRDYLLYLGILDLMKHHSITLFHALTYNERGLEFPADREEFYKYQQARQQALELMKVSVRMFYQTLFGTDYDEADLVRIRQQLPQLVEFTWQSLAADVTPPVDASREERKKYADKQNQLNNRFRNLEVSNPLIIALGAFKTVKMHPNTDMIIGIPSGGTETAIVTQMVFELQQKRSPQLFFLPISLHSRLKQITTVNLGVFLGRFYPNLFTDKRVLLVDDNSETGHTLGLVARALIDNQARKISVHLVDFSTRRLTNPINISGHDTRSYSRPAVSPSTLGLTQLDERGEYAHNARRQKDIIRAKIQSGKPNR